MKVYWFYYKPLLWINLCVSLVFCLTDIHDIPWVFVTFGFAFSAFFASFFYRKTSYLFYNLGYSRFRLLIGAFLINALCSSPLWLLRWI